MSQRWCSVSFLVSTDYPQNKVLSLYGRMIHKMDGSTYDVPYGRSKEHFILSISRLGLNQMLLTGLLLLLLVKKLRKI